MPLEHAPAGSPGFSRNVATEVRAGKPQKQAVAIAYSKARGDAYYSSPDKRPKNTLPGYDQALAEYKRVSGLKRKGLEDPNTGRKVSGGDLARALEAVEKLVLVEVASLLRKDEAAADGKPGKAGSGNATVREIAQAYDEGYNNGKKGGNPSDGIRLYSKGSEGHEAWKRGRNVAIRERSGAMAHADADSWRSYERRYSLQQLDRELKNIGAFIVRAEYSLDRSSTPAIRAENERNIAELKRQHKELLQIIQEREREGRVKKDSAAVDAEGKGQPWKRRGHAVSAYDTNLAYARGVMDRRDGKKKTAPADYTEKQRKAWIEGWDMADSKLGRSDAAADCSMSSIMDAATALHQRVDAASDHEKYGPRKGGAKPGDRITQEWDGKRWSNVNPSSPAKGQRVTQEWNGKQWSNV